MRFGIRLPHSGPLAAPDAIREVAIEAERLGFHSVWVHDHISYGRDWLGHRASGLAEQITPDYEPDFYEAIATLSYVAGLTERVMLGTSILVLPLRNPLVLGRQLITLQALSGGRLLLGVGVGDYPQEFRVLDIPYGARGPITEEYLAVLRKLFEGGIVEYRGSHISFAQASFFPRVRPPVILVAGGVRAASDTADDRFVSSVLRRVADLGDGWMTDWGSPQVIREGIARIRELRMRSGKAGRDLEIAMTTPLYLAETDEEARARTRQTVDAERGFVGSPETTRAKVDAYAEAGVGLIILKCLAPNLAAFLDMLRRVAHEVMPGTRS